MEVQAYSVNLPNLEATLQWGHRLGQQLFPGAIVALIGTLGAGKTHLTRAIAEGLEIPNSRIVNSPTFVLIQEYQARLPIYHFDVYRLPSEQSFLDLGAEEYLFGSGVCLIEWADRVESALPPEYLRIEIQIVDAQSRRLSIQGTGSTYVQLVATMRSLDTSNS